MRIMEAPCFREFRTILVLYRFRLQQKFLIPRHSMFIIHFRIMGLIAFVGLRGDPGPSLSRPLSVALDTAVQRAG
ncbi:MAG: hypothetical protein DI596_10340 [Azospira oryzae]|nr:MAG: hypothetical protein DI596_10340 [Azospira oryzae]PZP78471.1 MAG: hypothetical protein DI593_10340 [Azospira oryzae]